MRLKLLIAFLLFTLLATFLLWLLQVVFLDQIYRRIKLSQLERCADEIIELADGGDFYGDAQSVADQNDLNALLYYPDTGSITRINSSAAINAFERALTEDDCARLFRLAEEAGGSYMETVDLMSRNPRPAPNAPPEEQSNVPTPAPDGSPLPSADGREEDTVQAVICATLFEVESGVTAVLVLRTVITPISAARDTLFTVLLAVTVILLILAALLALFISRTVVRPIEQINRGAKRLAMGDYSYRFPESGSYREASELGATLNRASQELSKVEDLRRELIANVSHDLRTPLTLISGYSEVMRDLPGEITPENLQTIIDESARLTSLVNDLLEISKIQSDNLRPTLLPFSVSEMLRESVSTYRTLAACKGYCFDLQIDGEAWITGDRSMLVRALNNLINNALTHTGDDRLVQIRQITTPEAVRVEVTDTGAGIPQEKLQDIWDRYYKVDAEHKRSAVGTGLGLSIVKSIVSLHQGACGVRSSNGYGSTFWFELPKETVAPALQ